MISDSYILLDTCILQNLLSKNAVIATKTNELLEEHYKKNNIFAFSEFSRHELLRSANEKTQKKCEDLLNTLLMIDISSERLERATRLYSLYKETPGITNIKAISDIDLFIGALIFTNQQPYLLTANYDDFPRPFFKAVDVFNIEFKEKHGKMKTTYYYLLQGNLKAF